jgi:hypothetical protein
MILSFLKHQLNLVSSVTSSNLNILETNPSDLRFQKEEKPRMPEQTNEQPNRLCSTSRLVQHV